MVEKAKTKKVEEPQKEEVKASEPYMFAKN